MILQEIQVMPEGVIQPDKKCIIRICFCTFAV